MMFEACVKRGSYEFSIKENKKADYTTFTPNVKNSIQN